MAMFDKIVLEGNISRISNNQTDKYIWFDVCKNEKYKDKNGEMQEIASFFSAKIDISNVNTEIFKVGSWVILSGIPKSYIDKNNIRQFYIHVFELSSAKEYIDNKSKTDNSKANITYDTDGVMIWNGKRCESETASPEEIKEMEEMLSEFK